MNRTERGMMNDIKISIEVRIDAGSESEAREYAAEHGIDVTLAKWCVNSGAKGGRLYAVTTNPFPTDQFRAESLETQ